MAQKNCICIVFVAEKECQLMEKKWMLAESKCQEANELVRVEIFSQKVRGSKILQNENRKLIKLMSNNLKKLWERCCKMSSNASINM